MENELKNEKYGRQKRSLLSLVIHTDIEPGVLDNTMLIRNILPQGPKDEAGRLFKDEGVHLDETKAICLEFQNILRIDHLWMMTSLTKLNLAHNKIEKIENLEKLTNLKELDLSFNHIAKIENFDTLVNMEILTLFHNKIKKLENMCNLTKLLVFSIGDNLITDYHEVAYLRRFRELRSVSFKGNPCCKDPLTYQFISSALRQIKYLDYKIITKEQRKNGQIAFRNLLRTLDEGDESAEKERIAKEQYNEQLTFLKLSFVEYLSGSELLNSMFEKDPEGSILLTFGGELIPFFDIYKQEYVETMTGLIKFAEEAYNDRQNDITLFKDLNNNALKESIKKSKIALLEYETKKKPLVTRITELTEKYLSQKVTLEETESSITSVTEEFNETLHALWKTLMTLEIELFERCEDSRVQLEVNMTDKINRLQEESRSAFGVWRESEKVWSRKQFETLSKYVGNETVLVDVTPELIKPMMDHEELINMVAQSTDNHVRFIDAREDVFMTRSNDWRDSLVWSVNNNEINRNRSRILEINYFVDNQRVEWTDLQMALNEPVDLAFLCDEQ